eukprot:TRINITY_DN33019_c0_g1_i1.p1 TRINITY_DN33019_c0_g1~~TRINITY_DN33019_c0_g1_i1.p1  ORF type:complete len:198 (+),score=38.82 TRINITY_DN33019_c0_g1_i1:73-594(+)
MGDKMASHLEQTRKWAKYTLQRLDREAEQHAEREARLAKRALAAAARAAAEAAAEQMLMPAPLQVPRSPETTARKSMSRSGGRSRSSGSLSRASQDLVLEQQELETTPMHTIPTLPPVESPARRMRRSHSTTEAMSPPKAWSYNRIVHNPPGGWWSVEEKRPAVGKRPWWVEK